MGTAFGGVVGWQKFSVGILRGSDDQQQVITTLTRSSFFEQQHYGRDLLKLSLAGMAGRRACMTSCWYGGKRERLTGFQRERLIRRTEYVDDFDSLGLLQLWNLGAILPVAHRRLVSPVVRNSGSFSSSDHHNGAFEKHLDLPDAAAVDAAAGEDGNVMAGADITGSDGVFTCLLRALTAIRSILPYGSWWDVNGRSHEEKSALSFQDAMFRLWALISHDKLVISIAFTALVIAAVRFDAFAVHSQFCS